MCEHTFDGAIIHGIIIIRFMTPLSLLLRFLYVPFSPSWLLQLVLGKRKGGKSRAAVAVAEVR